jgi:hypothetical protein
LPTAATAQEEEASLPYVYATYFECDSNREWLADELFERHMAPNYDAAVEEGALTAWGYLAHHTGGKWRRVIYRVAPTLSQAMASVSVIAKKNQASAADASAEFGAICGSHDDYIWQSVTGSQGGNVGQDRGEAGFSTYFVCDEVRETEADDLVKESFAPLYDAQVEAGNLVSWGWMQHWVGGKYRRIATMSSKDFDSLMAARDSIVGSMVGMEEEGKKFSEICGSHTDYMWEIKLETP